MVVGEEDDVGLCRVRRPDVAVRIGLMGQTVDPHVDDGAPDRDLHVGDVDLHRTVPSRRRVPGDGASRMGECTESGRDHRGSPAGGVGRPPTVGARSDPGPRMPRRSGASGGPGGPGARPGRPDRAAGTAQASAVARAARFMSFDLRLAAWFLWMTPLAAALSIRLTASRIESSAEPTSSAMAALAFLVRVRSRTGRPCCGPGA